MLMGDSATTGLFEKAFGFRTSTTAFKAVHMMNDLTQALCGGAPEHGGDFLARVIRPENEEEGNSDAELRRDPRFGAAFAQAFPAHLGGHRIAALRSAAKLVLNFDKGVFAPGQQMTSPLATHYLLTGFEGFRRFRLGPYLASILTAEGREKLKSLFSSNRDPITRAFRPLLLAAPLVDRQPAGARAPLSRFDGALGERLSLLLAQPLSKPALLRKFALGASLGLVLKILGAGREGGRPLLLATAAQEGEHKPLREAAVMSFRAGVEALERKLAAMAVEHPLFADLSKLKRSGDPAVEVRAGLPPVDSMLELLGAMRRGAADSAGDVYWPDAFAVGLGRKAGCVLPKKEAAGWGVHLALNPEMIELLVLMAVPGGARPVPWGDLWRRLRDELGIVVGANAAADAEALRAACEGVSLEKLTENAATALGFGVRLGVARRLPDSGAEAGGDL
ncbi:MAG TPA: hypothetical protein VFS43_01485 [Polyangiaceae bacterium]|nr:hypothetical protein [Polyangiaceae bacterium]